MRIRLWTAILVSGIALAGVLATICRVPAGEIIVPTVAVVPSTDDIEVLPPITSVVPQQATTLTEIVNSERGLCGSICTETPAIPTTLVNSRRVHLNFEIRDVGPSGVSSVELWATRDGKSWQRYSNEPPPSGPLVVHVAEEGRYGFSILVRNGLGLASPAPKHGEAPQMWVDVDETKPVVKMTECHVGKGPDAGSLHVKWEATDLNMMAKPITIFTSKSKDGPWAPAVSGLENSGSHTWQMPKDMPYEFYVRLEATDRAGNVGQVTTHEPMKVDVCRPRGAIIGVGTETKPVSKVTVPVEVQQQLFDVKPLGSPVRSEAEKKEQEQVFNFIIGWTP